MDDPSSHHAGAVNSSRSTVVGGEHVNMGNNSGAAFRPKEDSDSPGEIEMQEMAMGHDNTERPNKNANDQNLVRIELTEELCIDRLPYGWGWFKKWWTLTVIFLVQTSMNFNTSLYSNGIVGISKRFNVSEQAARGGGAASFLIAYAFGCELWAPWSEDIGRKPILQLSLFLVNVWAIPVALAPNFATIVVFRILGGFSTAGGSVTLAMIADMFPNNHQQFAVAYM